MIPAKRNRRAPIAHDGEKHRRRDLIQQLFDERKNWRPFATR